MSQGAHDRRTEHADPDALGDKPVMDLLGAAAGSRDIDEDDVGLDLIHIDAHPRHLGQGGAQGPRIGMVLGQTLDIVLQRVEPGGRDNARLAHGAAELVLEAPGSFDEIGRPGQNRTDRRTQPLGEV